MKRKHPVTAPLINKKVKKDISAKSPDVKNQHDNEDNDEDWYGDGERQQLTKEFYIICPNYPEVLIHLIRSYAYYRYEIFHSSARDALNHRLVKTKNTGNNVPPSFIEWNIFTVPKRCEWNTERTKIRQVYKSCSDQSYSLYEFASYSKFPTCLDKSQRGSIVKFLIYTGEKNSYGIYWDSNYAWASQAENNSIDNPVCTQDNSYCFNDQPDLNTANNNNPDIDQQITMWKVNWAIMNPDDTFIDFEARLLGRHEPIRQLQVVGITTNHRPILAWLEPKNSTPSDAGELEEFVEIIDGHGCFCGYTQLISSNWIVLDVK